MNHAKQIANVMKIPTRSITKDLIKSIFYHQLSHFKLKVN